MNLKQRLTQPKVLLAPGVYDAFSALIAEQAGFEFTPDFNGYSFVLFCQCCVLTCYLFFGCNQLFA